MQTNTQIFQNSYFCIHVVIRLNCLQITEEEAQRDQQTKATYR